MSNKGNSIEEGEAREMKIRVDEGGCCSKRTPLEKALLFIMVLAAVAIIALAVTLKNSKDAEMALQTAEQTIDASPEPEPEIRHVPVTQQPDICLTKQCAIAASQVLSAIDESVDPCTNFYDYACTNWIKTHVIPEDRSNLYSYGVSRDKVAVTMRRLYEEDISDEDIESVKNAKRLYQSCINESRIEERGISVAFGLLEELGGWPVLCTKPGGHWREEDFRLEKLLTTLMKYNNRPIVSLWVGLDDINNTRKVIFMDQPSFGLPERNYYLDASYEKQRLAYKTFIKNVAVLFGADPTQAEKDVEDIMDLETDLARISMAREERRDNVALYNRMTVTELKQNFTEPGKDADIQFDWLLYLQSIMNIPGINITITEEEEIVIVAKPYFRRFFDTLQRHSRRAIANYAVWRILRNRVNNLHQPFIAEATRFRKEMYGAAASRPRWKKCVSYVTSSFQMVAGRLFIEDSFNKESKEESLDMIKHIRDAFYDRLQEVDWMDEETKQYAHEKAKAIMEVVGYPDYIFNNETMDEMYESLVMHPDTYFENVLTRLQDWSTESLKTLRDVYDMEQNRWSISPTTVNAFYSFQRNQITFPAGILQVPHFNFGQPRSMNYGGIGFLIGHEITHGFDDRGRQYDKDGLLQDWWTKEAESKFKEKAECLIKQYGNFYYPEAGRNLDGVNTQGENIADNGGVRIAYMGYKKWVEERGKEEPRLPGVNMTHDRLFFVNVAQIRCGSSLPGDALNHVLTGAHSPNPFRVIGSLQNMPEFSKAFNCPVGSYMNPEHKCRVW